MEKIVFPQNAEELDIYKVQNGKSFWEVLAKAPSLTKGNEEKFCLLCDDLAAKNLDYPLGLIRRLVLRPNVWSHIMTLVEEQLNRGQQVLLADERPF